MRRRWRQACVAGALLLAACGAGGQGTPTPEPGTTVTRGPAATTAAPEATTAPATTATARATSAPSATQAQTTAAADTATAQPANAANIDPSRYTFTPVASGFKQPLLLTQPGDGSGRLFVVEQDGLIRIVRDGQVLPQPFLDVSSLITTSGFEQGLLGLAFSPDYANDGLFYINYTDVRGDTVVARYSVSPDDPDQAQADSAQAVLTQDQPYPNHNGGNLVFGPDGYLYIGLGDGGSAGDPQGNGQNLKTWLGKLLRIDVRATALSGERAYGIPPDNPFASGQDALPEIWAYGLRNPWRFSFDRATGDLYIADVGQNQYEEIDFQPAGDRGGENYGWSYFEGQHPFKGTPPAGAAMVSPVAEYSHSVGGCSVTGGYVYRGPSLPELHGVYFYGDYCSGLIWVLTHNGDAWQSAQFAQSGFSISSFGEDEAGELYVLDHSGGVVYRLAGK